MDDSESICDGRRKFFGKKRGVQGVLCKNSLLGDLLESQNLLEILQTSLTFRNSEKVVKSRCFEKLLRWRPPILFRNKEGIKSLLCKDIDVSLNC